LFLALIFTFSRGAYLGVIAAAFAVAWLLGWRRIVLALGGLVAAGGGVLLADGVWNFLPGRIGGLGSTFLRLGLWRSALAMLRDHPIFGVGLDQFLTQYPIYIVQENYYESSTSHPHNLILDFWLRLGIIGLLVFGWTLARFVRFATILAQTADPVRRALALGLIAALTDAVVHGLLDNSYFVMDLALVFWLSCALLQILRAPHPATRTEP
jgi:O-antigen ligase